MSGVVSPWKIRETDAVNDRQPEKENAKGGPADRKGPGPRRIPYRLRCFHNYSLHVVYEVYHDPPDGRRKSSRRPHSG